MPKKHRTFNTIKPSSSAHPSLASSASSSRPSEHGDVQTPSVSEQIEHLRRTQGASIVRNNSEDLRASQHAPTASGRRRPAGPPPPRSGWVVSTEDVPTSEDDNTSNYPSPKLRRLPGIGPVKEGSLQDLCLKAIATDYQWHLEYDHAYLSTLPIEIKSQLLSYVAVYGSRPMSASGLETLFLSPQESDLPESTGSQEVFRLDLARSLGRTMRFSQIEKLLSKKSLQKLAKSTETQVAESWEDEASLDSLSLPPSLAFPRLTRLSLSHPSPNVSWQDFLSLSRCLGSLTHLCLDFWPEPALPDVQSILPDRKSLLDDPIVTRQTSDDEDEAAVIFALLCRNTTSLQWLSVAGCHSWFDKLAPRPENDMIELQRPLRTQAGRQRAVDTEILATRGLGRWQRSLRFDDGKARAATPKGIDWNGAWKHVRYVNVSQDWIAEALRSDDLVPLVIPRKARSQNREAMRSERFRLPPEPEYYHLSSSDDQVQRMINIRLRRSRWLLLERMSIYLASSVDRKRMQANLPTAEFDFGWGRAELLEAGYEEQMVFDAGL